MSRYYAGSCYVVKCMLNLLHVEITHSKKLNLHSDTKLHIDRQGLRSITIRRKL